jgi:uncharacterized UPF0160 family protein
MSQKILPFSNSDSIDILKSLSSKKESEMEKETSQKSAIPRTVGVHDGTFHADEVTACALLLLFDLVDRTGIYRTRDQEVLDRCEFVCDVGGIYDPQIKRFDHHQANYKGTLSSAGMILSYLREIRIILEDEYNLLNDALILGVDAHDNGKAVFRRGVNTFSQIVSNFTPVIYGSGIKEQDAGFFEAVEFVQGHLKRMLERFRYIRSCRSKVDEVMKSSKEVLFFNEELPWLESFFQLGGEGHPARFVVMPSGEHWKLRAIPPSYDRRMQVRTPLPRRWAGLLGEELQQESGISGAIFCHKERFISVWKSKEAVMKALEIALRTP